MLYLRYTLSFLLLSVASASYLPMAQAQTSTTPVISIGLVPGCVPSLDPRRSVDCSPGMFIEERLTLPLEYTADDTDAGLDTNALNFSAYVFNADGTTISTNQTGRDLGVLIEGCLLVDGQQVDYDPSHPYYDNMIELFRSFAGFPREPSFDFGTSCADQTEVPSSDFVVNGENSLEGGTSSPSRRHAESGSNYIITPVQISRTVDLIGQLSIRIRIERITYRNDDPSAPHSYSDDGPPESEVTILEERREMIIHLRDTTELPPLGFDFVSVTDGADSLFPRHFVAQDGRVFAPTQQQYPDILAGLNNANMHTAEHAVPEGAIIQFRPRFQDAGGNTYHIVGRPGQTIDIPLQFTAGVNPARFGGAFVALRGSDTGVEVAGLDEGQVRDNRCRLLNPRKMPPIPDSDGTATGPAQASNINDTVDYCLQQRGIASENLRLASLDPAQPAIIDTTGTSTILLPPDDNGIVQLALRIALINSTNSVTLITGRDLFFNPFQHLLMGLVIAAPKMPADLRLRSGTTFVSGVVPVREANTDLTLEPDEHFSMRWSTTNPNIRLSDASQRNFVIRGHSPQTPLFHSERFARIQEFGLSASDIHTSNYLKDDLRYFPYFEFPYVYPAVAPVSEISAVTRESESVANAFTLRWVADTPHIALGVNSNDANDARLSNQPLYYTDTIERTFEFTFVRLPSVRHHPISADTIRSLRARATLPAAASPTELLFQVQLTGEEDLNAINERFNLQLSSMVEVTPSLSSTLSEADRTLTSTDTISIDLVVEDDDPPPQIGLSYRLFDLAEDPYNNTGGALTEGTLSGYRVQGGAAIVNVARDTNPDQLNTATMPRFPNNLSRYRFGIDVPEHNLSLPAPEGLGTIVGRGTYLVSLDNQPIDLAPHFELYAVFVTPKPRTDSAFSFVNNDGIAEPPTPAQYAEFSAFAGMVHPHNLGSGASDISSFVDVGTREALNNTSANSTIPSISALLPQNAQNIMLFARISHDPNSAELGMSSVLQEVSVLCDAVLDERGLTAVPDSSAELATSNFFTSDTSSGNFLVSINDHRHAAGSADKLDQPFSILNIAGAAVDARTTINQYGFRENIATMNVALLCASDPSLSPDQTDNLNADGSAGPEYCATRMQGTGSRSYCQVGQFDLNYTDYLPELYAASARSGSVRYLHRSHTGRLYEADAATGVAFGFEAGTATHCQIAMNSILPRERCNRASWEIRSAPRFFSVFYGDANARPERLEYAPKVNTLADDTRLQWAISVVSANTQIDTDESALNLVRVLSTDSRQMAFDNPRRGTSDITPGLADSLALLTSVLPEGSDPTKLAFATQVIENDQYRNCALLSRSADAIQLCRDENVAQTLRVEPAILARVYDSRNNPAFVRHAIATAGVSTATITIEDPDAYMVLERTAGDGTIDEASPGANGRFVEYSVRFGGTSDQMTDLVDLALIFYAPTASSLQMRVSGTEVPFFTDVDNPIDAASDIEVQVIGPLAYGGLWSDAALEAGVNSVNPLTLFRFANAAGNFGFQASLFILNNPALGIETLYSGHKVLLALRFPRIAPSVEPQPLVRVYANPEKTDSTDNSPRDLRVALGVLSASARITTSLGDSLDYLQVPNPTDSSAMLPVQTAGLQGDYQYRYVDNYKDLQGLSMPITQSLRLLSDDTLGVSIVSFPNSNSANLVEQNGRAARHEIIFNNLLQPYTNSAGTQVTPTAADTRVLLRLDFSVPEGARVSANNNFFVDLLSDDRTRERVGPIGVNPQNGHDANPVYILLGAYNAGDDIPAFVGGNCAGLDIRAVFNPIRVRDTILLPTPGGASFFPEVFATDSAFDPDFYGDQAVVYTTNVVCSEHELLDPAPTAASGHACTSEQISTTARSRDDATTINVCPIATSPVINVIETVRPDILLSLVTTEMDASASVADILANASATHDLGSNLVLSTPEPDAARPAINRAAIATNQMALIARLSDNTVNRSGSPIVLNRLSDQLDQLPSQFTFVPSPQFTATGGIPDGANGVVIGTILPLEDELMEGNTDYSLLAPVATDYIVATRASAPRAAIHTQLPMVTNPITGTQEQQAADYEFRLALDLSGTPAQTQVQNQILPTLHIVDADDYFHYIVEGPEAELVSDAERNTIAMRNTILEADAPLDVNIRVGFGGAQIAWSGNNPTNNLDGANGIIHRRAFQNLAEAVFDRAAFLDTPMPTFAGSAETFINQSSTLQLIINPNDPGDYELSAPLEPPAIIVPESDPNLAAYRIPIWARLQIESDSFFEGDEYVELAFAMRERSPADPAMPRALRRLGSATHLRYEIIDSIVGDAELGMEARATAVSSQREDYPLPIISEYLLSSDVVSASNNTAHATVSVLTLPGLPPPGTGIITQIDVYGHLASRDGDLVLAGTPPLADAEIPEARTGYTANVAGVPVRRFYVQLAESGTTGTNTACVADSGITADQVITQIPLSDTSVNEITRFQLPISLGARRPSNVHSSTRYGGTRVLRLHASILCSDVLGLTAGTPIMHQWQDPDVPNTTNTDTHGIPVLLRDRADEHTLSYFVAATDSLPQAGFTPRTQLGLHEAGVVRPLPNTFAQLHIHAALTPTSAKFGDAPIVLASDLQVPIPISALRAITTGICEGSEDCVPTPDTDTTDYYLGSIRAATDANNTWEPNSQLQLIGANTAHESAGTSFASAWLSTNTAIVSDPLPPSDPSMPARNALLVPSMPSAMFNDRVFNAPALIVSTIPAQNILLQDAQSFISVSATTPTSPGFTAIDGIQGDEDRGVEFQIHLGGMPTQMPVAPITGLPDELNIQLGFVFRFAAPDLGNTDQSRPDFKISDSAGNEFRLEAGSDARTGGDLILTQTLGFNSGDTNTTATLTRRGSNAYYFEARLALDMLNDPVLTTEGRQRVLLRIFVDDDAGTNLSRIGTVQAHLVEPDPDRPYYIYPQEDPIAPSAVNFMLDGSVRPLIPCATYEPFVSRVNDYTQPYPRDCLSAQSTSAYAFSVETGGLDFVFVADDSRDPNPTVDSSPSWRDRLIRVHYYSPAEGATCASPPINGPLPADSPYVSGRYAGHTIFLSSNDLAGTREGNIVYVRADDSIGRLTFEVDTRATGPAGATYCAILEVNLSGLNAYTEPASVNLPSYSMDDDNNNGLPDDLEISGGVVGASQAMLYGRDYCRRAGSSYNSQLGALNDCDNDGVPDLAELQYGPPEDNSDYTLSRVMCIAQGYYTRFPRTNLGNLLCTNSVGNQLAASQTIAAIEADWLLAIRGKDYAGVALEVDSVGPPTTFRADNGLLPSNSYWFANPDQRQVVEVYLAPTMRFRAPTSVLSALTGHTFTVIEGNFAFPSASHYPMTAQLLGTVPESVGADIALELETYASDGAPVDPPLNTQIRFEPHSSFTRTLGTYRDHTVGYSNDTDAVIVGLLRRDVGDTQSSATATIDYAVYFDRPNHPLHGAALRDQRRAGEYYEIDLTEIDGITSSDVINPLPETLQLLNAPTTASITTALGANPTASTLDFILREHQILTQNAGVLYLGPHPAISTPTGLSDADAMTLQEALRAQVDLSANYILGRDGTASFPFTNTSETWSLLPLGDESAEEIVLHTDIRTTGANPYTLPDVATLCNLLPTCQSETGGVDYARLLYRQRDLDTTGSVRIVYIAQLWLQLGGDPAQLFDDTDEDGVPEMDGDIEGALSLPFSASGRHGHIVVEQQQVALQLGYRARTQYQTDLTFARGANIGSGDTLDLDFHLSCVDHAGQPGDLLYEFDANAPATSYDLLRDISGGLIDTIPTPSISRDDLYYAGCLGYEVPVLIQMPESMAIATNINIPNTVAGFGVKSYSFSGGLPDGSCPQANAESVWWRPDGAAPRAGTERCMRLVLEGDPAMAGLPLMPGDSEPLRVATAVLIGAPDPNPPDPDPGTDPAPDPDPPGPRPGGPGGDVALSNVGQTGGSGGGAFGIMQLLLLGLLVLSAARAPKRRTSARAIS